MPPKGGKEGGKSKAGDGTSTEPKVFQFRSAKAGLQVLLPIISRALPQPAAHLVVFFFSAVILLVSRWTYPQILETAHAVRRSHRRQSGRLHLCDPRVPYGRSLK